MESSDSKRVKFAYDPTEENEEEDEANDLDLDTIRASASRNDFRGLKEFDSEGSEDEEEQPLNVQLSESESEGESIHSEDFDEREIPLIPFNLREDREEGNFDVDGFYTRKQDEEADQDRWMANFTRSDIIKARKAHQQRHHDNNNTVIKFKGAEEKNEKTLYLELADLLIENDDLTVAEVIRRVGNKNSQDSNVKPRAPLNKNRLKKLQKEQQGQVTAAAVKVPGQEGNGLLTSEDKMKINKMTELADYLMDLGNFDVYEETRRGILSKYK